jgi:hypothetical protein
MKNILLLVVALVINAMGLISTDINLIAISELICIYILIVSLYKKYMC